MNTLVSPMERICGPEAVIHQHFHTRVLLVLPILLLLSESFYPSLIASSTAGLAIIHSAILIRSHDKNISTCVEQSDLDVQIGAQCNGLNSSEQQILLHALPPPRNKEVDQTRENYETTFVIGVALTVNVDTAPQLYLQISLNSIRYFVHTDEEIYLHSVIIRQFRRMIHV